MHLTVALVSLLQATAWAMPSPGGVPFVRSGLPSGLPSQETLSKIASTQGRVMCIIKPGPKGSDDAPAIVDALTNKCRSKSLVYLPGPQYNIMSPMTTRGLQDVQIHLLGKLLWSPDVQYWLGKSMPVAFQNQSTVWYFGGDRVQWDGYDKGELDGNGQVWYDWAKSQGNLPHRPMNINFDKLTNSVVRRMRFVQSQMWTMAVTNSKGVEFDDIYVSSVSNSQWNTLNTDGCDTIWSDSITFRRWFVRNGDDAIATKMNSTNIRVYDSVFEDGQGVAIGSLAQYNGHFDVVRNFYARNITLRNTAHVSYIKTWAGVSRGPPPNGGGGGLGEAKNIVMEDIKIERMREQPFFSWQCENYSGWAGKDCDSSKFKISDVAWRRVSGTVNNNVDETAYLQCSAAAGGCNNIEITGIDIKKVNGKKSSNYICKNVHSPKGFRCSSSK
ncbi:glycoside hydrolase family 28 [Purpureocillium lavendulum]|uniref:Glycoside hydrolase family 28 n=1 Tax=Purpureocillium lavendulum TaxID=1247861 RepID=A0AB34FFN4_9HYPO|nr:glycoside hydrolase family 28 [Purpureocillium lavendulum]